jgi:hypothetical protein
MQGVVQRAGAVRDNCDKAIAEYDTALGLYPGIARALYRRGIAKLRKGQNAKAPGVLA